MRAVETKTIPLVESGISVKAEGDAPVRVTGYGSYFGNVDSYGDIVLKGAYQQTITEWSARGFAMPMLFNHDTHRLVGKWVRMVEDERGLLLEGELTPGNSASADLAASLKHGAVSGLSIGFRTIDSDHNAAGNRLLKQLSLFETSVVVMPANDLARVGSVKSIADEVDTLRDFERFLREAGWSRREAEAIAAGGFKAWLAAREERQSETPSASVRRRDDGNEGNRAPVKVNLREAIDLDRLRNLLPREKTSHV